MGLRSLSLLMLFGAFAYPLRLQSQAVTTELRPETAFLQPSSQPVQNQALTPSPAIAPVHSSVEVTAEEPNGFESLTPAAHITQQQLLSAAGTYGDFTRYLQTLPGVVWNSDLSNEILVRGGHPVENLYVVDGIEIPNINHFSLAGSNGGFTSMIDSSTIGSVDLRSGIYDSSYSSRLSSMIQVRTRQLAETQQAGELTVGISGAGGFYQRAMGANASILVSAHRSIVSFLTKDVGINGVPVYSNALTRLEWNSGDRDTFSMLTLSGLDSISMHPCVGDFVATSLTQTEYDGWRSTEALGWDHTFSAHLNSHLTASSSLTSQHINQQLESGVVPDNGIPTCTAVTSQPTYLENSHDGQSVLNYMLRGETRGWLISGGASGKLISPDDRVKQPLGQQSPFSVNPASSDAIDVSRHLNTGQTAAFLQAEGSFGTRFKLLVGIRGESFAIDHAFALDPRLSIAYRLPRNHTVHASWGRSSQLPPMMDMLTYPQNHSLGPVQVQQESAGIRLLQTDWGTLDAEAYKKTYRHEAISADYPQLALSNMIDTLGQSFVWLPLTSGTGGLGTASSRGLEVTLRAHAHNRLQLLTSATYSRTTYRALDGIERRGNYDFPLVANTMANLRLPGSYELNARETFSSGRPYTPYDMPDSLSQNRGIYDLSQLNGLRGPIYNRLDLEFGKRLRVGKAMLDLHGGADNILDRRNLLGYVWMPNCEASPECSSEGSPVSKIPQMGLYPAFSARYIF